MSEQKYKLTDSLLDTRGGIVKLEKDGFTREVIHKQMYALTNGMDHRKRTELMKKLYDRRNPC